MFCREISNLDFNVSENDIKVCCRLCKCLLSQTAACLCLGVLQACMSLFSRLCPIMQELFSVAGPLKKHGVSYDARYDSQLKVNMSE